MIRRSVCLGLLFYFLLPPMIACADDFSFSKQDKILIVAPHPDDEALGTGGLIQQALGAGAEVKIVYLTHGESNEISSLFYQKKPMITKVDFVKVGRLRKKESIEAMKFLGVPQKNLIFLGYPDMGTMPIWERFWNSAKPFRSFFTRINKVIHDDDFSYGKYYRGFNLLHDFEKVLLSQKPTHVFVTAPFDLNLDHQAAYLFLKTALLNLRERLGIEPALHLYLIHEHDWPKPRKHDASLALDPPDNQGLANLQWDRVSLDVSQIEKKEECLLNYESQIAYSKNFLLSFVRGNEIFTADREESILMGPEVADGAWPQPEASDHSEVKYRATPQALFIEIPIFYALDGLGTFSTNVFGFNGATAFTQMPKLKFRLFGGRLFIKNGTKNFHDRSIRFKADARRLFLRVPWTSLGNPEVLFVSTRTAKNRLAFDFGSWRVLRVERKGSV